MIKKVEASSPGTNEEDLQYILDNIDVDNYFDYMAFEMFFGNSDPGNIRFYKLDGEGQKWKWIFYDADYGLFNVPVLTVPPAILRSRERASRTSTTHSSASCWKTRRCSTSSSLRLGEIYQVFTTDFHDRAL